MLTVLELLVGLVGLWLGTELTVRGAATIAARFSMSEFLVGVTILSVGSDLPELTIALDGAIKNLNQAQVSDVIVGSALGSALAQIGFVLGLTGLFGYLTLPKRIVLQHGSVLLGSLVLLGLIGLDGNVSRTEGISLLTLYGIYFVFLITDAKKSITIAEERKAHSLARSVVYLLAGLLIVIASAELVVRSVDQAAQILRIQETFVAVFVIGLGTSLPELSISLGAILKRHNRMSVGNLIGSNIFDTLVPIGVAATIAGVEFDRGFLSHELPFLFLLSAVVLVFLVRKKGIQHYEALTVLLLYCGFVLLKLMFSQFNSAA